MIYLDHNATTPVLPEARDAMLPYLEDEWGNPSSSYRFGSYLKSRVEAAREQVADLIGAKTPRELAFTSGGTERNGHATQRLANTSNLTFHGIESEALLLLLDQAGICASSGSACLADSPDPSHVIAAMKPGKAARQCVRFSLGEASAANDNRHAVTHLAQVVATLCG